MTRLSLPIVAIAWLLASSALAEASAPLAAGTFEFAIASSKSAMMGEPKIALDFAQQGLNLAKREPASKQRSIEIVTAQWLEGEALVRLDRKRDAQPVLDEAFKAAITTTPNSKLHADLLMAEGGLMVADGRVQEALADYQNAYRIFGGVSQPRGQAKALQQIGSIYQDAGDYARVLRYYQQSAELFPKDPALLLSAYNNTARAYTEQKNYRAAKDQFRRALDIAVKMKSPRLQAFILSNLAATEVDEGAYQEAARSVAAGLRATSNDSGSKERAYLLGVSARAALKQGQVLTAKTLLERTFQGVDLAKSEMAYRDFHATAYETYLRLGDDHDALIHLSALKRLDDQAHALASSTNSALMSAQFDYANQVERIDALKAGQFKRDIALARSRNVIQMILLAAAGGLMCLLIGAFFWIRRGRDQARKANVLLETLNEALQKALLARSEFLATTSHEIRTPLNGILGMTQVMLANQSVDPVLKEQIRLVHSSGETMRDLINDILDVAKIENGKLEIKPTTFDLHALLGETIDLWMDRAREKGLELKLDVGAAPRMIVADVARMRQIMANLVSNAIKFTDQGRVSVTAKTERNGDAATLVLCVEDTGIGISAEDTTRVFESFGQVDGSLTRLNSGTGLGLSICKSLAEAMGGEIALKSRMGQGSTFTVRVPWGKAETAPAAPVPEAATDFRQVDILIVEPNPLSQSILRAMLDSKVRAVETIAAPSLAMDLLAKRAFDIVVVDLAGLSTNQTPPMEALAALAKCDVRLIAVLAPSPSPDDVAALHANGAGVVIGKPISASAFNAQLQTAFIESMNRDLETANEYGLHRKTS